MKREDLRHDVKSYDRDFYEWTRETADLIEQGHIQDVDLRHVAEEIRDMGKRDRREVRSRMTVIVMHLLKWQLQPELRDQASWRATITEQRRQFHIVLDDSPSLYDVCIDELPLIYMQAVRSALAETGLPDSSFPPACPYRYDEVLSDRFFPDGPIRF